MQFKNILPFLFFLIIFSNAPDFCFSQSSVQGYLVVEGLVYGYSFEPSKKIFQKEKQIKVEGVLNNVVIHVLENGKVVKTTHTNSNGVFLVKIKTGKIYTVEFSKSGYAPILLSINLIDIPKEITQRGMTFSGVELILNSFQSKNKDQLNQPFGKLFYNKRGDYLDFEATKFLSKKEREYINNPVSLMMRSVQKNKNKNKKDLKTTPLKTPEKTNSKINEDSIEIDIEQSHEKKYTDTINQIVNEFSLKSHLDLEKINETDIQFFENYIKKARIQFEKDKLKAKSTKDSLLLNERECLLNTVELELSNAKKLIEMQKNKISTQRELLFFAIASVLLLSGLLFFIYRYYDEKKRTYLLLDEKNKKITDSIHYASRIQKSILPTDAEIKKQLPESFVYFKPRDIVSGDFYWLSTIDEKIIIACVDCTGHGVPGAFMSLIGNTLLNEIVNAKKTVNASLILEQLHLEVLKALHQNTERIQSGDGMEMSLCIIDTKTNTIEFTGAMNPLYIVKDNTVTVIKPDSKVIGRVINQNSKIDFTNQTIPIQKNMSIYMFTDGYMDQFGGSENKKFNIPNFKKLLVDIQVLDMDKQKNVIEQTIQKWQGANKQVDDMLVIGIRF